MKLAELLEFSEHYFIIDVSDCFKGGIGFDFALYLQKLPVDKLAKLISIENFEEKIYQFLRSFNVPKQETEDETESRTRTYYQIVTDTIYCLEMMNVEWKDLSFVTAYTLIEKHQITTKLKYFYSFQSRMTTKQEIRHFQI